LFFRLGVEQRAREVGLLRAVGYTTGRIRGLFAVEGLVVTMAGSVIGIGGAIAYAWVMMTGLGSWWSGAVGTDALRLHVSATSLAGGVIGVAVTAMACLWWTLRGLSRVTERSLLSGNLAGDDRVQGSGHRAWVRYASAVSAACVFIFRAVVSSTRPAARCWAGPLLPLLVSGRVPLRRPVHRASRGDGYGRYAGWGRHAADVRSVVLPS
jgi:hypothetical protein